MTGNVVNIRATSADLSEMTLEQLFAEAGRYGRIGIYEDTGRRGFRAKIEFDTTPGATLEAASDFNCPTIADGLIQAIDRARVVAGQFK